MSPERKTRRREPLKFNKRMQTKLAATFIIIVLLLFVLGGVISHINFKQGDDYSMQVLSQRQYSSQTIPYKRGDILDRNGNIMASSVKVYNLILDPKAILEKDAYLQPTVKALTDHFKLESESLIKTIQEKKNSQYVVTLTELEYKEIEAFKAIQEDTKNNPDVKGVWFETEYKRKYPYNETASSVLGFTCSGNEADWGIEGYYNKELNGVDGREYGYVNDENNMEKIIKKATDGNNVVSTIDIKIQDIVEKKMQEFNKELKAKGMSVLIMDPRNGEILAMANKQAYNPNKPRDLTKFYSKSEIKKMSDDEQVKALSKIWKNECIGDAFEPGSTMKPFTVAAALEEGIVSTQSQYKCDGFYQIGSTKIKCHKESGHGKISLQQAIALSCNDALMQIGLKMGKAVFSSYQNKFGFGSKTGLDLIGETAGQIYTVDKMGDVTLATNAFGQNFTVNMVQLASGYCSLVNGGNYYAPHVVKQVNKSDGALVRNVSDVVVKQTVTRTTSDFLNKALRSVVTDGTGSKAAIKGYEIAGKTGTAEKIPRGKDEYVLSFIGSVPYDNPEVVCYATIDTPASEPSNSAHAAKLFKNIMTEVLPYLNIFKSDGNTEKGNKNVGEDEAYNGSYFSGDTDPGVPSGSKKKDNPDAANNEN